MPNLKDSVINLFEKQSENVKIRITREFTRNASSIETLQMQNYKVRKLKYFHKQLLGVDISLFNGVADPLLEIEKIVFTYFKF